MNGAKVYIQSKFQFYRFFDVKIDSANTVYANPTAGFRQAPVLDAETQIIAKIVVHTANPFSSASGEGSVTLVLTVSITITRTPVHSTSMRKAFHTPIAELI